MEHRDEKLSSLIRDESATFIRTRADIPPGILLTVTHVTLSSDRRYADVFISVFPTRRIGVFLEKFKSLQHEFNAYAKETLRLKNIPAARFKLDEAAIKQERIEHLLEAGEK